jgi:hypothetical protein
VQKLQLATRNRPVAATISNAPILSTVTMRSSGRTKEQLPLTSFFTHAGPSHSTKRQKLFETNIDRPSEDERLDDKSCAKPSKGDFRKRKMPETGNDPATSKQRRELSHPGGAVRQKQYGSRVRDSLC